MATGTTEPSSPDEDLNQDLEGLLFSFHAAKEKYFPENIWPDVSLAKVDLDVITTEVSRLFLETLLKVLDKCVGPAAVECFLDTGNMKRFEFVRKEGPENNDVLRKPLAILRKWDTIIFGFFNVSAVILDWDPYISYHMYSSSTSSSLSSSSPLFALSMVLSVAQQQTSFWAADTLPLQRDTQDSRDSAESAVGPAAAAIELTGANAQGEVLDSLITLLRREPWRSEGGEWIGWAASKEDEGEEWVGQRSGH